MFPGIEGERINRQNFLYMVLFGSALLDLWTPSLLGIFKMQKWPIVGMPRVFSNLTFYHFQTTQLSKMDKKLLCHQGPSFPAVITIKLTSLVSWLTFLIAYKKDYVSFSYRVIKIWIVSMREYWSRLCSKELTFSHNFFFVGPRSFKDSQESSQIRC